MRPLLTALLFLCLSITPVDAKLEASEEEKVIFAYFKLVEIVPHYKSWIKSSTFYKETPKKDQERIFHIEERRLKHSFGTFDHTKEFLRVQTNIEIFLQEKKGKTKLEVLFPESADAKNPYFPYAYRKDWIALIISDLGRYTTLDIGESQKEDLKSLFKGQETIKAQLNMRIRPQDANAEEPLEIEGQPFWIMTGDVAYLEILTNDEKELFSHTAPWYLSETENDILKLLEKD